MADTEVPPQHNSIQTKSLIDLWSNAGPIEPYSFHRQGSHKPLKHVVLMTLKVTLSSSALHNTLLHTVLGHSVTDSGSVRAHIGSDTGCDCRRLENLSPSLQARSAHSLAALRDARTDEMLQLDVPAATSCASARGCEGPPTFRAVRTRTVPVDGSSSRPGSATAAKPQRQSASLVTAARQQHAPCSASRLL